MPDVQKVLNELLDFKAMVETKDFDLKGRRVRNAATSLDKNDYVTRQELPGPFPDIPTIPDQFFTVVFDKGGVVSDGETIPRYIFGRGRQSIPVEIWLDATGGPTTADLAINIQLYQKNPLGSDPSAFNILPTDLVMPQGTSTMVNTRTLIAPPPKFGLYAKIQPVITTSGTASNISIGVVCKVIL